MDLPEARQRKILLFDFYDTLLTARQREIFTLFYMEDNSLSEIGMSVGITPQAVADMLNRVTGRLNHYEKFLQLAEKSDNRQKTTARINLALDDLDKNPGEKTAIIKQIRRLLSNLSP